jgi:hypothetical protein
VLPERPFPDPVDSIGNLAQQQHAVMRKVGDSVLNLLALPAGERVRALDTCLWGLLSYFEQEGYDCVAVVTGALMAVKMVTELIMESKE